jgi:glycosyltransferase involved in cell wall biosynthesis
MAAGRPIILAIDGVIRQVIEEAGAGIYVEPGQADGIAQAILQLEQDRAMGERMGLAGRRFVEEHFDRSILATRMLDIMVDIVQEKNA